MNTPLNDALNPCAHCGCHNPKFTSDAVHHFRHTIKCQDCPMLAEFYSSTRDQAIAAWNRRANTPVSSAAQGAIDLSDEDDLHSVERAADLLECYADHIKSVGSNNLQYHAYLPEVQMVAKELRKLAQPSDATAQQANEAVGIVDEGDDGLFIEMLYGDDGSPLKRGDKVYLANTAQGKSTAPLQIHLSIVNGDQWNAVSNKSRRIVVSQKTPEAALKLALEDAGVNS